MLVNSDAFRGPRGRPESWFAIMSTGSTRFIALSRDPMVRGEVLRAAAAAGERAVVASEGDELLAALAAATPRAVIIDRDAGDGDDVVRRLAAQPGAGDTSIFLVIRDTTRDPPVGAHVL